MQLGTLGKGKPHCILCLCLPLSSRDGNSFVLAAGMDRTDCSFNERTTSRDEMLTGLKKIGRTVRCPETSNKGGCYQPCEQRLGQGQGAASQTPVRIEPRRKDCWQQLKLLGSVMVAKTSGGKINTQSLCPLVL